MTMKEFHLKVDGGTMLLMKNSRIAGTLDFNKKLLRVKSEYAEHPEIKFVADYYELKITTIEPKEESNV